MDSWWLPSCTFTTLRNEHLSVSLYFICCNDFNLNDNISITSFNWPKKRGYTLNMSAKQILLYVRKSVMHGFPQKMTRNLGNVI